MGEFKRKSDGRRIFTSDFKRSTVERIRSGTTTLAEVSRELEIAPAVLRNWMRLVERGGKTAVEAGEEVVALSRVRELEKQVRELQRLVGKQAMTIEILEAAREIVKKVHTCSKDRSGDRPPDGSRLSRAPCGSSDGVPEAATARGCLLSTCRGSRGLAPDHGRRA
jgi:transposase